MASYNTYGQYFIFIVLALWVPAAFLSTPGINNTNNKRKKGILIYFIFFIWTCQEHFSMLN